MTRNENLRRYGSQPYDGLFGDSNLVSVLEEVIADPHIEYRPIDLARLTKETPPTVRKSLKILTSLGLLIKDKTDLRHPIYKVNTNSKRYLALNFLAYAILDDKLGTDTMDRIIADYCDSVLREKYATPDFVLKYMSDHSQLEQSMIGIYTTQSEPVIEFRGAALSENERYEVTLEDAGKRTLNLQEPNAAAV